MRARHGPHLHFLRMVHESPGDGFNQLLHGAPLRTRLSSITYMCLGKRRPDRDAGAQKTKISGLPAQAQAYAIFCKRMKLRTVSLGCAPTPSQYLMRSASSLISAGFFSGSYLPTSSRNLPLRGRLLSITTTR